MTECPVKKSGDYEYYCSFELTIKVIGGKWKPIILYHLSENGTRRFGEVRQAMPDITQKMLTQQLRELEKDGLIDRTTYAQVPPKVEYALTELGRTIIPVLHHLRQWGLQYEALNKRLEPVGETP